MLEQRTAPAERVRAQDRAGRAHLDVERLADDRTAVRVEQHRNLVVRHVLELLHHQLAALRGRPPVHLAQRLALLVLADAVQVEPGRPPQHDVTAGKCHAELREDALELDEARIDEERRLRAEVLLRVREPERVLEHGPNRVESVAAARYLGRT